MKGASAWVIQLIEGIIPRWADDLGRPTNDKRKAKIYHSEDDAIGDFVKIGTNGPSWPFAKVKEVTLRK